MSTRVGAHIRPQLEFTGGGASPGLSRMKLERDTGTRAGKRGDQSERRTSTMTKSTNQTRTMQYLSAGLALAICVGLCGRFVADGDTNTPVLSSRAAFLRAQRASRQQQASNQTTSSTTSGSAIAASSTTSAPSSTTSQTPPVQPSGAGNSGPSSRPRSSGALAGRPKDEPAVRAPSVAHHQQANRTTRTADVFQGGDGYNIFVTNTCEREQMLVKITMSREFNGVIHTRNQRQKSACTIEGNGGTEYTLNISHVLNPQDPNYCGAIKARRESPEDRDLLSVVIVVRFHRDIELSDDKFFLLNCTNRCRRPDCSAPGASNKLLLDDSPGRTGANARVTADETPDSGERETVTSRPGEQAGERRPEEDDCTIWKFPWLITLLWCMGILLLAMIISHCIMCSSLVCRCVKTEVEEREPSVYEDDETDDEDKLYNKKNHPMRIDYDNRDIYKTSNNYDPYCLDETETAPPGKGRAGRKSKPAQRR